MSKNTKQPGFFAAFFGFRRMVSPAFITLFYYLGLIGILVGAGFALMGSGPVYDQFMQSGLGAAGTIGYYVGVVVFALISILVLRFYSELLIVLFAISNRLSDISAILDAPKAADPEPAPTPVAAPAPAPEPESEPEPEPQEPEDNSVMETQSDSEDEDGNADADQEDNETENKN